MNRVQREKAGWRFRKGEWRRRPRKWQTRPRPAEDESYREPGDTERGPEPPPAEPAAEHED